MRVPRWLPVTLWAALVFTLTSIPNPSLPAITGGDKAVHAIMYGVLAVLALYAWPPERRPFGARLVVLVVVAALGAADEWHQHYVPGRSADVRDWVADTLGALVALALTWIVMAPRRRES